MKRAAPRTASNGSSRTTGDLIDAEFAINEGGGGVMRKGRYVTNEVQAAEKVYQDFRLEVRNAAATARCR